MTWFVIKACQQYRLFLLEAQTKPDLWESVHLPQILANNSNTPHISDYGCHKRYNQVKKKTAEQNNEFRLWIFSTDITLFP